MNATPITVNKQKELKDLVEATKGITSLLIEIEKKLDLSYFTDEEVRAYNQCVLDLRGEGSLLWLKCHHEMAARKLYDKVFDNGNDVA